LARLLEFVEAPSPTVAIPDQQGLGQLVLQSSMLLYSGSLSLQASQTWFDFANNVINALEVSLRLIKARDGILTSSPVRSNPGSLLKKR